MILDMNLFKPGDSVPSPGLFTVLEEVPGFIKYGKQPTLSIPNTYIVYLYIQYTIYYHNKY